MPTRFPTVAGMFYPADEATCRTQIQSALSRAQLPTLEGAVRGGIVPHAGWTFSGSTAGHVFAALQRAQEPPETVILFGAVHHWGVSQASVYGSGSWQTPLGALMIDEELARELVQAAAGQIVNRPEAHREEHSIEVQLPFVKYLWPEARIVPIAVPPESASPGVGRGVAQVVRRLGRRATAIGSSDLTHYGPRYGFAPVGVGERALEWTRANDARLLDLVVQMRADEVKIEAETHHNACGPGAIAATIAYAAEMGAAQGQLLYYTTSHDVMPMGRPSDMVGYGAVILM